MKAQGSNLDLNPEPCAPKSICTPDADFTVAEMKHSSVWCSSSLDITWKDFSVTALWICETSLAPVF